MFSLFSKAHGSGMLFRMTTFCTFVFPSCTFWFMLPLVSNAQAQIPNYWPRPLGHTDHIFLNVCFFVHHLIYVYLFQNPNWLRSDWPNFCIFIFLYCQLKKSILKLKYVYMLTVHVYGGYFDPYEPSIDKTIGVGP